MADLNKKIEEVEEELSHKKEPLESYQKVAALGFTGVILEIPVII